MQDGNCRGNTMIWQPDTARIQSRREYTFGSTRSRHGQWGLRPSAPVRRALLTIRRSLGSLFLGLHLCSSWTILVLVNYSIQVHCGGHRIAPPIFPRKTRGMDMCTDSMVLQNANRTDFTCMTVSTSLRGRSVCYRYFATNWKRGLGTPPAREHPKPILLTPVSAVRAMVFRVFVNTGVFPVRSIVKILESSSAICVVLHVHQFIVLWRATLDPHDQLLQ
ncbi:hypothetical protein PAXRUDRAFT_600319 [Paxillus rubicundulus Ve08.2h10]|uniref:Uncharacterized protein n=1 Tax=Paxillus rubicundulus Ve08.2h10 TaxID=930991 RepID=A0A0D0EAX3_9AGAM|nr:hypothetical protein PAXRUDRAFT_600319 [Paxillus rubicundulus Ve08.2h10]